MYFGKTTCKDGTVFLQKKTIEIIFGIMDFYIEWTQPRS